MSERLCKFSDSEVLDFIMENAATIGWTVGGMAEMWTCRYYHDGGFRSTAEYIYPRDATVDAMLATGWASQK